jgi:isoamylase
MALVGHSGDGDERRPEALGAFPLLVHAPDATQVFVAIDGTAPRPLRRHGDAWIGDVPEGSRYGLVAEGPAALRFDRTRTLVDPLATAVWFPPGHSREAARRGHPANHDLAPRAVARPWPAPTPARPTGRPLVVYEAHVRGMTMRLERGDAGTFRALIDELPRLADLGVSVLELLPVQQFDPDEPNYWGYMPLVFGAVHEGYAATASPAEELAELVAAAHEHDLEVWLDVVFNHTTEEDEEGPTYNLRALADRDHYVLGPDGSYADEAGTGNTFDVTTPASQHLVMTALDRFADLGVGGFRFDLATVLARDPAFVRAIGDWAEARSVRLVAEPWDMVRYQVGRSFPDARWMQWNDRFRDEVRGFLRGEPGMVRYVMRRIGGSPDLFDAPSRSVNFLTAHDGFTMYDLVAYDRKHNLDNGHGGADGPDENRSWNCGWEGDVGAPAGVRLLRRRQLRNAMCLLLLSHGVPMFVAGDEFGRTQRGNNNPFNQDNEVSWIDWDRRREFLDHEEFVRRLLAFRDARPILSDPDWWGEQIEWFGAAGAPDRSQQSRSLAWHLPGLYVMANMWWEALEFEVRAPGPWSLAIDTAAASGFVEPVRVGPRVIVGPRSIIVLTTAV